MNPSLIRSAMRAQRRSLSASERAFSSFDLLSNLRTQIWYLRANLVATYLCTDGEISLAPVITDCIDRGKQVSLPKVHRSKSQMQLRSWRPGNALSSNRYGILEPVQGRSCPLIAHSLLLAPLVAFDDSGNRIGMGGGYYDRLLAKASFLGCRPLVVGVAYDFQQLENIESKPWDQNLDAVVTDKQVIAISARLRTLIPLDRG